MAKKGRSTKSSARPVSRPAGATSTAATSAELPRAQVARLTVRQDPRRIIYIGFNVAFTILYLIIFSTLLHNRFGWARAIFYMLPACTLLMGIGTLSAQRWGWFLMVAAASAMLLWTVGFIILLLRTAAFLAGVYGAFGQGAAMFVLLSIVFVIQLVGMVAGLQLKWGLTRAGRAAFGQAPLWPRPGATA
jgi:hypothetical protein